MLWDTFIAKIARKALAPVAGKVADVATDVIGGAASAVLPKVGAAASNIASQIGNTATAAVSGIAGMQTGQKGQVKNLTEKAITAQTQQAIADNAVYVQGKADATGDLLLKAAAFAEEEVISPYITRPFSTLGLVTDVNSPLYAPGKYERGFQLSDISRAYKRSEEISLGVAFTQSDLIPGFKRLSNEVLYAGGVDIANVNLWDDQNVQKNFSDNIVGRYFTGGADFIGGNAILAGAGKVISTIGKTAIKSAGLSAKGRTLTEFEQDANDGILNIVTNGERGRLTNTAQEISQVAESKDINLISGFVQKYSNNERLIPLLQDTTDPAMVRDYLLADKGYLPALERLATKAPDDLAELADLPGYIRSRNLLNDDVYQPVGDALPRIKAAFESAIKKNPEHAKIYQAFLDADGNITSMGKTDIFPLEPKFATEKISKAITGTRAVKAKATTRDFSKKSGNIDEQILGTRSNGMLASIVRFTGTYKPLGFVTFSGARPFDGIVELNAMFDDIKLFTNGQNLVKVGGREVVTAAEYRSKVIADFTSAPNTVARRKVLDDLDAKIVHDIARSYDMYDTEILARLQSTMRQRANRATEQFGQHGFGMDATGRGVFTSAQTQSQIAESFRMSPLSAIEREILRSKKGLAKGKLDSSQAALANMYETLTKYWTFDVLARPSYIVKQSWAEPILSAGMSQGTKYVLDQIPSLTKNSLKNTRNRIKETSTNLVGTAKAKEVGDVIDSITKQLSEAIQQREFLSAEAYKFFDTDLVSPATKRDYSDIVKADLKRADDLVEELELELQNAAIPFGGVEEVPSIATLERRLRFIEASNDVNFKAKNAAAIANTKAAIVKAKGDLNTLVPDAKALTEKYDEIAALYDEIDNVILKDLGEAKLAQAKLFERSPEYKKRYYGKESSYVFIGDQYVKIDSLFDENQLGTALREEFANARTTATTFAGELTVGTKNSILLRRGPRTVTNINEPLYFEELAYVANRTLRNDPLVKLVLNERSLEDVQEWALTDAGRRYMSQFGEYSDSEILTIARNRVGLVKRTVPDVRARALLLEREVTSIELQKILSEDLSRLSPLHPIDFDYDMVSETVGAKGLGAVEAAADRAMGSIWSKLTSPENPVRWSFADKVFRDIVARKAQVLADQGVELTVERMNALRAAATRESLQEAEKTFYTVRRKNRAVWASRVLTAFPAASLNAFYRYGRFAIKNPTRMAGFLHNYQSTFRSFGVDENGNPVDDPRKAKFLLVPGTKELGFNDGKGVLVNARSLGFLINIPAPSYIGTIPMTLLFKEKPGAEETFRQVLGPTYDAIFPYGPPENILSPLMPSWAKDLYKSIAGPEGDGAFMETVKSVANYHNALAEMGIEEKMTQKQFFDEARGLYFKRFRWGFASPLGVPTKVDTNPMALFDNYYNTLINKYLSKNMNRSDAMAAAEQEFLATVAPNFPIDRVSYKGSTSNTYVPATASAYNRIWKDNSELIESVGALGKDGALIGLLTLDIDATKEDTNLSVYRFLKDPKTRLPDGSPLNKYALTPEKEEKRRQINRVWEKYTTLRDALDAQAQAKYGKPLRRIPELSKALSDYANTELKAQSPDWWKEKNGQLAGGADNSFNYARAFYEITNDKNFMKKYGDSPVWQDAQKFTQIRNAITTAYQSFPQGDPRKSRLKEAYLDYIATNLGSFHPKVQEIMKRYFDDDTMKVVTD